MEKNKGLILGLSGHARSGKDTFAKYLVNILESEYERLFKVVAFAYRLKQMCAEHFNLNYDQLWGDKKEESTIFTKSPSITDIMGSANPAINNWTSREIMQEMGSFYRKIDSDFWVRKVDENWKLDNYPDTAITDVRHINECEYVKKNGVLIKIVRENADQIHNMNHESETALDGKPDSYFDIIINNDGSLEDLQVAAYHAAKSILKIEKLQKEGVEM